MKRSIVILMMTVMAGGAAVTARAAEDAPAATTSAKQNADFCKTHCNIMDLEKKIDSLKAQSGSEKMAMKDHLEKDIAQYEKKLTELKAKLDAM